MGNFESPEAFVRKLAALIERALDAAHAAVSDIGSIGIGIPGAVKNGEILYTCNLPLTGVPLAAMLAGILICLSILKMMPTAPR